MTTDKINPLYLVTLYDEFSYVYRSKERAEKAAKIMKNSITSSTYINFEDNLDCHGKEEDIAEYSEDMIKISEISEGESVQGYLNGDMKYNQDNLRFEKEVEEEARLKENEYLDMKQQLDALKQVHLYEPPKNSSKRPRNYSLCSAEEYSKIFETYGGIEYQITSKRFNKMSGFSS